MKIEVTTPGAPPLEFRVFGPLQALSGGETVELGSPRQRTTLAVLLLEANKVVPVSQLVDALYGDDWPSTARSQIQIQISSLRRLFGAVGHPNLIETHPQGYRLAAEPTTIDRQRFEDLVRVARGARDPELAVGPYREARRLCAGPALQGLSGLVIESAARRLDEVGLDVVEEWIDVELTLGRHHELVGELAGLVEQNPLRERLRGQYMLALHTCGRTADALQSYQHGRAALIRDLGLEPGDQLQQLHGAILRNEQALRPEPAIAKRPGEFVTVARLLPQDIGDFVGQDAELSRIGDSLRRTDGDDSPARPLIVIGGGFGVGKTALAVHLSHALSESYADGQLFVDLHGSSAHPVPPAKVLKRFINVLGPPPVAAPTGLDELAEIYRNRVAGKRILIVLDDAEGAAQIAPLLPGDPDCAVLITSRSRITEFPDTVCVNVGVLEPANSLELLGRIAGAERVRRELAASSAIVELCGHHPLALRIVGARLAARPHWSVRRMHHRLSDEAARLDELRHNDMSMRDRITTAYEMASAAERQLFRRLALLPASGFDGWVGSALLDESVDIGERVLDDLADLHLIEVEDARSSGFDRYSVHVLVRDFARERLRVDEAEADSRQALHRVLGGLLGLSERVRLELVGSEQSWAPNPRSWWPIPGDVVERTLNNPADWYARERSALVAGAVKAAEAGFSHLSQRLVSTVQALA